MNEKVYVVLTTYKNFDVYDWYNDCTTGDTERYVLEIVGVYSTYDKAKEAAIRARNRRPKRRPWADEDDYDVYVLMRTLDCDQEQHDIVYYIPGENEVHDDDDDE
jgi:hypothetical protein